MSGPRATGEPPPPSGAGAGGGGRSNAQAPDASARPPSVAHTRDTSPARGEDARPRKLGHGWSPDTDGGPRQKDRTKTKLRAQGLRKELTASERKLWLLLRDIEGAPFRKEVAIGDYVFDFACYGARLLIELDGPSHQLADVQANDKAKEAYAIAQGFRVLRFRNNDVWDRPAWVIAEVRARLDAPHPPAPAPRGGGGEESSAL